MEKLIFKANSRGTYQNEWLNTKYSFSFADYFDTNRINFGALRVLNDDIIQPSRGFGKHPHDNMEIITIPLTGALSHMDSMGHKQSIGNDEVQVMSAGSGIFHSEFNASESEPVSLLQIWIIPHTRNIKPRYDQKKFIKEKAMGTWQELVSGFESNQESLFINQYAKISRIFMNNEDKVDYQHAVSSYGSFLFVVEGSVEIDHEILAKRDAIGISKTNGFSIKSKDKSYIINIEVPDYK